MRGTLLYTNRIGVQSPSWNGLQGTRRHSTPEYATIRKQLNKAIKGATSKRFRLAMKRIHNQIVNHQTVDASDAFVAICELNIHAKPQQQKVKVLAVAPKVTA